jgi:uncharacterized protein (TIGR03086 family)
VADDLVELHGRCGRRFTELVAGVRPEQWHDPTPCSEWDVRMLVHHVLNEQYWVAPLLEGLTVEQVGDRFDGDMLGDDPAKRAELVASAVADAHAAVAKRNALVGTVHLSYGDDSAEEYVMQLTADLAIHGWDLASATGQDDALDANTVELLLPWAEANIDMWASMGLFAARVDVGEDAPGDVRLLAVMGRRA